MNTTTQDTNADTVNRPHTASQPLERPLEGRMLGGVAAGIADFLGVDPTIVRIVFAVLTVVGGGAGVVLYLAGWLLIPEEGRDQSMASDLFQSLSARSR
jgi:phage shock protein C